MISDLQTYIQLLKKEGDLKVIDCLVDPHLEAAEIHRRVIAEGGPALLFTNIKGAKFPLVTNLYGTTKRIDLSFGKDPQEIVKMIASLPIDCMPPTMSSLWKKRKLFQKIPQIGIKNRKVGAIKDHVKTPPKLTELPLLTTWEEDGGGFITLPLVYTEHPETGQHNLGMYRIQRFDDETTGLHFQIGKGGGFHLKVAEEKNVPLPVNIFVGGPPALTLSAIAPLPENVPELMLASLVLGKKLRTCKNDFSSLSLVSDVEFALVGEARPHERRPEGPFGDHYGYYSLKHDYPVFRCKALYHRKNAILPATVVGKPRQEDFYLGDYLQELLSPLFPIVMPTVKDLWSYGETGYHSLATAVVRDRYKREAMVSAFRILGEGQLALTKFLLVIDKDQDIRDFKSTLEYVLERTDFRTDLYILSNLAMDTLDYTGPKVNQGSKGVLLGVGEPLRQNTDIFSGDLPPSIRKAIPFCKGCLVLEAPSYAENPTIQEEIAQFTSLSNWPLVILVDDAKKATLDTQSFLWTTFTRFEPGADITAAKKEIVRNHIAHTPPIFIDARMKPNYPDELFCDKNTSALVDNRWKEYFSS